ncbi:TPA: hypothetical protein LC430_005210, partial [Salmonella enterica subsp. enterica serovar Duisburg]|nr:hypothetical protein [Salmonella enterica subsp. enterica serovar Duisburg]
SLYCQSLNELRARQAHMLKEVGDQWCTPDALWWGINARFGPFVLDLFADHHNARCEAYYTAEDNALAQNWSARLASLQAAMACFSCNRFCPVNPAICCGPIKLFSGRRNDEQ